MKRIHPWWAVLLRRTAHPIFKFNLACLLGILLIPLCLAAQTVYLKPAEALKLIFSTSSEIILEKKTTSADQKQRIEKILGYPLEKDSWNFYIAKTGNTMDGYALIDNEIGKTEPITFLTAINPKGQVKAVEILVYRESHGSEVHEKPFMKQYAGKSSTDPIRVGQDIKNMTGATLSARAVSKGVKRNLALWNLFYGK